MTPREIVELRLRNQHLVGAPLRTPALVVRWLGAMQAQDYPAAKWSVGMRTIGASETALDAALSDGTILRTHVMRPTWHFVLPADIRWLQTLTAPRVHALVAHYRRRLGLDEALFAETNALLGAALDGGRRLTRVEISALLRSRGIAVEGERLAHVLMRAELDLVICSGGLRGRQQTYAALDERVPAAPAVPRDDALATLAHRYFSSHGPATERDLAWWSGLTLADVRRGLASAASQLDSSKVGDRTYWFDPTLVAPRAAVHGPMTAHLLQGFDEYVIAYSQSRDLLDLAGVTTSGADERLRIHVIALDGQVVARWRRALDGGSVTIDASLGRPLSAPERRAVQVAAERYGRFFGRPVRLELGR